MIKLEENHQGETRNLSIDVLKIISIVGVIFIHSCSYNYDLGSVNWISSVFWGSLFRASVPIFFMCSGALFLSNQKVLSIKKLFTKNILRIILAMYAWALLYKIFHLLVGNKMTLDTLFMAMKQILIFDQEVHLYYLQIMFIIYIFLPITKLIVQHASKVQIEYLLVLWFIFGIVLPTVEPFWPYNLIVGIPLQYKINMTYSSIGYTILGHYLVKWGAYSSKKYAVIGLMGFFIIFAGTVLFSRHDNILNTQFFQGMSVGVCLLAYGLFGVVISFKVLMSKNATRRMTWLSKSSFCIYLCHFFFIYILAGLGITSLFAPALVSTPIIVCIVFLCSLCVYAVLSHVPIINKWFI